MAARRMAAACLLCFPPVPHGGWLRLGRRAAEQQPAQGFCVKGKEGPEIAEAAEGGRGGNGEQHQRKPDQEAGQPEESGGGNQEDAVKAQAVAEFRAGYGEGGKQRDGTVK